MVEEKIIETNSDWAEEFQGDAPATDQKYFSDKVPEGELSFRTEITFLNEGTKETIKTPWGQREVITFKIQHEDKEKTMQVGTTQFDYLKIIAEHKPITNKKAIVQRTGTSQKDTRRTIKFLGEQ